MEKKSGAIEKVQKRTIVFVQRDVKWKTIKNNVDIPYKEKSV